MRFLTHRAARLTHLLSLAAVTAGCAGREDGNGDFTPGLSGAGSAGTAATAGGSGGSASASANSVGPLLDVGVGGDSAGTGNENRDCGKIDFLFVVDNSGSMIEEQMALVASFPGFMDTVVKTTGARDFQVMVIDTDSFCDLAPGSNNPCNSRPPANCDEMLGAGRIKGKAGVCPVGAGARFMKEGQADLPGTFACLGVVGTDGSADEVPFAAVLAALGPMNAPGACNAGFLRDDALLVLVFISDEDDDDERVTGRGCKGPGGDSFAGSPGNPDTWFNDIVKFKGVEKNIVVLSLVGPDTMPCPGAAGCSNLPNGAQVATQMLAFTRKFTYGKVGPVCSTNYSPFFADAVSSVADACRGYTPPR